MKTILIMEDQTELASFWREVLEEANYRVLHASNMEEATALLSVEEIDVVITDMLIREENNTLAPSGGLSLMTHINLHVPNRPKIIAVSGAHPDLHVLQHARVIGAKRTLIKPFTPEELLDAVSEVEDDVGA